MGGLKKKQDVVKERRDQCVEKIMVQMVKCRSKYQGHEGQPRAFLWELLLKIAPWVGLAGLAGREV